MTKDDAIQAAIALLVMIEMDSVTMGTDYGSPHVAERARKAIALLRALPEGWQPIETAPKDGRIRLWVPGMPHGEEGDHRDVHGRWNRQDYSLKPKPHWGYDCYLGKVFQSQNQPTHWQPESAPPKSQEGK